jgi:hypothetical protein
MDDRHLDQPSQLFEALFEIYNLASVIRHDKSRLNAAHSRIPKLKTDITKNFKDKFTSTKRTHNGTDDGETGSTKRSRTNPRSQGGHVSSGIQHGEHVYDICDVAKAFAKAGYVLESNGEDENGWAPLNEVKTTKHFGICRLELMRYMQLKPTMRHAIQPDGTAVVLKLIHARSNELSILQYLDPITSACNHTIPLLGTFNLSVGTFIVTPEATPLDLGLNLGHFHGKVADLSQQLVDGVAFLHEHGVAHLDIKPGNIIVARRSHLYIIDFDISVRVYGPGELIDRWLGTPPWMAPEIGDRYGPRRPYSPIRADLWSCGLVLRYLASKRGKEDDTFETLAGQLLNKHPHLRPMLSLSCSGKATHLSRSVKATHLSSSGKAKHVSSSQRGSKRRQDAVRKVTGKATHPPSRHGRLKRKRDAVRD